MEKRKVDFSGNNRDDPDYIEKQHEEILYVMPKKQRFMEINPRYFHGEKDIRIILRVQYNSVEICHSRASPEVE